MMTYMHAESDAATPKATSKRIRMVDVDEVSGWLACAGADNSGTNVKTVSRNIRNPAGLYFDEVLDEDEELFRVEWLAKIYLYCESIGNSVKHIQEGLHARRSAKDAPYCLWGGTDEAHHWGRRTPMRRKVIDIPKYFYASCSVLTFIPSKTLGQY